MELVWGTEDFLIAGQPYRGFPILLWDSMESSKGCSTNSLHPLKRLCVKRVARGDYTSKIWLFKNIEMYIDQADHFTEC